MPDKPDFAQVFADLERARVADPERTLEALGETIPKAVRGKEWGTACLLTLAAYRIDAGKSVDLNRISHDLERLFAEWER